MKKVRKIISLLIVFFYLFSSTFSYAASINKKAEELTASLRSDAVLIMEASTRKSNF